MSDLLEPVATAWLWDTLAHDATLLALMPSDVDGEAQVYEGIAPGDATPPYVVYFYQGGHNVLTENGVVVMGSLLYTVKAVGRGVPSGTLEPIANRVNALVQGARIDTSDGYRIEATNTQELALPPLLENGIVTVQKGAIYRLQVHAV